MDELVQETPHALALIVCDQLITDERTKKRTLVGIFNSLNLRAIPATHPEFVVYVSVRGGKGKYRAALKLCHQATDVTTVEFAGDIEFRDPFHVVEIAFRMRRVPFTQSGTHCLEFYCSEELILSRPFEVHLIPSKK